MVFLKVAMISSTEWQTLQASVLVTFEEKLLLIISLLFFKIEVSTEELGLKN